MKLKGIVRVVSSICLNCCVAFILFWWTILGCITLFSLYLIARFITPSNNKYCRGIEDYYHYYNNNNSKSNNSCITYFDKVKEVEEEEEEELVEQPIQLEE